VSYPSESPTVDHSKTYLFKIMGTIATRPENKMVLCRSDFTKMIKKRADYLKHFEDFVKDGTILFIGYSGADRLVTDIIDEVIDQIGIQRLPWSYILVKEPNLSEKEQYRFQNHRMIPVQGTFEEFFEKLGKSSRPTALTEDFRPKTQRIRIEGKDLVFDQRELEIAQEYFEILHEGIAYIKPKSNDEFFKGLINYYGCYADGLDFIRDIYDKPETTNGKTIRESLKDRVIEDLKRRDPAENKIFLIKGPPGVGKSVLLHRLAFDVYSSGVAPVVFLDKSRMFFDYKLLASFFVKIDRKFDEESAEKTHRNKPLIIIDDSSIDPFSVKTIYLHVEDLHLSSSQPEKTS
jgi:hypothetical protein